MAVIYLRRWFEEGFLQYDLQTGRFEELLDLSEKEINGEYNVFANKVVGVYSSPEGPLLFCNDQRFPIYERTYSARIQRDKYDKSHIFSLIKDGVELLRVPYQYNPIPGPYFDPWPESEEDYNFLIWLSGELDDDTFYTAYTKDFPTE